MASWVPPSRRVRPSCTGRESMSDITAFEDWPTYMASHPLLTRDDEWASLAVSLMGIPTYTQPVPYIVRTWEVEGTALGDFPEGVPAVGDATEASLTITEYAWDCGFGPQNHGYLIHLTRLDPATLPGLMHYHSHNRIKVIGAYRDLPLSQWDLGEQAELARQYGPRQFATVATLAALKGYAVFCPDTFSWGARRFGLDSPRLREYDNRLASAGEPSWRRYDDVSAFHEHIVAKAATDLGTSYSGMIAYDDLMSLDVARTILGATPSTAIGHSGGGGRSIMSSALNPDVCRVGVLNMMTTLADLLPDHVATHSWLLHIPGLARAADYPDLAANRRTQDLFVLYGRRDSLFPPKGMAAAHRRLTSLFAGEPGTYTSTFLDCDHDLTAEGASAVLTWLSQK